MTRVKNVMITALMLFILTVIGITLSTTSASAAAKGTVSSVQNVTAGISVSWTRDKTKSGYNIYRRVGTSTKWVKVKKIKTNKTLKWVDKKTVNGKLYTYKVCSFKKSRITPTSRVKKTLRISTPKWSLCSSRYIGTVDIRSNKTSKVQGYILKYASDSTFKTKNTKTKEYKLKNPLAARIIELKQGKNYYFKLRSYRTYKGVKYYSGYTAVKKIMPMDPYPVYLALSQKKVFKKPSTTSTGKWIPFNEKLTYYGIYREGAKGTWYQIGYNGKTYYAYKDIEDSDPLFNDKHQTFKDSQYSKYCKNRYQLYTLYHVLYLARMAQQGKAQYEDHRNGQKIDGIYRFDCSGFVQYAINTPMKNTNRGNITGYQLPWDVSAMRNLKTIPCTDERYKDVQVKTVCKGKIKKSVLEPGDLLFYDFVNTNSEGKEYLAKHAAIYIGNGYIIQCTHKYGVCIVPTTDSYGDRNFIKASRVLPEENPLPDK